MALLRDFKFHSPDTLLQALALLEQADSPVLLAGGTFALNTLKKSSKYPTDVISLRKIPELNGIKTQDKELWIGPMTRIDELIGSRFIQDSFVCLKEAALKLGTTPIRNMATIGGNVASRFYWVDLPAVLIALGARLEVVSQDGGRVVGLYDYLTEKKLKKEIVSGILLPLENRGAYHFRHTCTVQEVDTPYLGLTFSFTRGKEGLLDVRAVVNTTLSFPVFLKGVSSVLQGLGYKEISLDDMRKAVCEDIKNTKLDEYRIQLLCVDMENILSLLNGKAA
jgi:CO/xanthine dehydrogenase FAD-binding subunit